MTDSLYQRNRKMCFEKQTTLPKRNSEMLSPPNTPSQSQSKGITPSAPTIQQRKIFGFEMYIDNDILNQILNIESWFQQIMAIASTQYIGFNNDLSIPDLDGHNIQIYDKEMQKKYQCCKIILNDVYQIFKKKRNEHFSIIIFVPQGMVSLLIGTRGHQINKIMKQSHTVIVVNQPISKMTYRTVKIQGYHSDIAMACKIIYQILQQKSSIAYSIEKEPSQLDYSKAKVKTRFIISNSLSSYLSSKKKSFIKKVEQETKCSIKFKQDANQEFYKRDQEVCILSGRLEDVQAMLVILINLIHDYYCQDSKNVDYTLKMLIPSNYVTKLIGQKGYMIRDIIERSGGAQIKILSQKQTERDARQCIIAINGTRQNKIDASCLILQQIQCFKNGGPILQSGKSINQNLAQQFKNSLPLRNQQFDDNTIVLENNLKNQNQHSMMVTNKQIQLMDHISNTSPLYHLTNHTSSETKTYESNIQNHLKSSIDLKIQREIIKEQKKSGKLSSSLEKISRSPSRSRERRDKREIKKQYKKLKRDRSVSSSIEFKHEKDFVQIKIVLPKKLANDRNQLTYIQSLCKSEIKNLDQLKEVTRLLFVSEVQQKTIYNAQNCFKKELQEQSIAIEKLNQVLINNCVLTVIITQSFKIKTRFK